jgi:hypothetical protein
MSVELVVAGDWAGAQLSDVKAVAQSVVEQFPSIAEPERLGPAEPKGCPRPRSASATLSTFLESWRVACVAPQRGLVTAINDLLLDR